MRKQYNEEDSYTINQVMDVLIQMAKLQEAMAHDIRYLVETIESGGTISEQVINFIPE